MQPLITGGAGDMTFQQAQDAFLIDALTRGQLEGGLTALGIDPTGLTLAQAQAAYQGAATSLYAQAAEASMNARLLGDKEADAEKTGIGFTPIISVNFKPSEKLNIALKYEHNTKLELKNKTNKDITLKYLSATDSVTMFPDGAEARLDVPSMISLGATYRPIDKLMISAGAHYFLEKNADWAGREDSLEGDFLELSLGLEYNLTDKIKVSGGYVYAKSGAGSAYQTDMSYSLTSHSFGFGGAYRINDMLELNLGGLIAVYQDGEREPYHELATIPMPITETLDKSTWIVSVGLDFYFGK
jgi:long-subunit fatty acid transport protein